MPGTLIGAFVVDYFGPKYTMIFGLCCQAIVGFIMSGLYKQLTNHIGAFAVVYGIFLSFGELGPGNCLGLLAAKSSPSAVRGQYYGIAAAIGKIGAFAGTWSFKQIIIGKYIDSVYRFCYLKLTCSLFRFRWSNNRQGQHRSFLDR